MKRLPLLFVLQAACFAQGIITTVAGTDYIFPDEGQSAAKARLVSPSGLALDAQGNLFIADFGLDMVLRIDPKGVINVIAGTGLRAVSGNGGAARAASFVGPVDLAVDASGNIYVADLFGTSVRKISPTGVITQFAGSTSGFSGDGGPATKAQMGSPTGVAVDRAGNVYIADPNFSRVRKVDPNGIITTFAGNGQNISAGDGGPATGASLQFVNRVAVDASGNVYISQGDGRIRKVDRNGIITTVIQNLAQPMGMAFDANGNVLVCEQNFQRVVSIDSKGNATVIAGNTSNGFAGDGGPATAASFSNPVALAVDTAGTLYIADKDNGRVRKTGAALGVAAGALISTIAGVGAFTGDGGPAVEARFNLPQGVTTDAAGNLYIADSQNYRVRKVTPGGIITTVAGTGHQGLSPEGTLATSALISVPQSVAIDPQGNLVFAEGFRVRRINTDGGLVTIAGSGSSGSGSGGDGGPAILATLSFLSAMVYDNAGNLYLAEQTRVRKISPAGIITAFAGNGQSSNSGDGGPATSATFTFIRGLAADQNGNIYIGDNAAGLVRRVDTRGIITTVAGNGKGGFSTGPGPGTSIPLNNVAGLATDRSNNLFIAESGVLVRKLDPSGALSIYAGNSRVGTSGDGGSALAASFDSVDQLYCDPAGNLYISDSRSGRVRVVQAGPSPSIVVSQKGLTFGAVAGGSAPASQNFTIVNGGQGTLTWGVTASTASGGNWLSVTPASGSSAAGAAGPPVQVTVNPTGLAAGDYYGQVLIRANAAPNTPQSVTVVLNVRPIGSAGGTSVQPTGLLFTASAIQSFTITTLAPNGVSFSSTATSAQNWFTVQPGSGTVSPGKPATVNILPSLKGLAAGVYNGSIAFAFSDNSAQTVQLLLVVTAGSTNRPAAPGVRPAGCTPGRLLPLFTSLGSGFNITTGWPSPVELRVVDDCGQPLTKGSVTASFSNTDPSLTLNSLDDGRWTGTWLAQNAASNVSVTASALTPDKSVSGTSQISGGLNRNANPPPAVAAGGVLNAASYQLQGALAPGSLVSIFGTLLSQGTVQAPALPLTNTLGGTTVTIAGRALPLLYAGPAQVNAMVPYDLPINATHQLIVQRGTAISVPQPISVLSSQSGVFTKDLSGTGTGIVVKVAADGTQSIVGASNPVSAFDALVIYCAGLGDVTPRQIAGQQVPFSPLSQTLDTVKVVIGGVDAPVFFAGVTPGFTGLYQVNAYVPTGVTPGDNVPLVITQAGRASPAVSISVR